MADQATRSVERAEKMTDLRERYRAELRGNRSRAAEVIDLIFGNPILTTRYVASQLSVSSQGAANLLRQLTELKVLREDSERRRGVRGRGFADKVIDKVINLLDP